MSKVAVPAEAIAKFRKLRAHADGLRAANRRLSEERQELQEYSGKLSIAFTIASKGRQYVVADNGEVFAQVWHEDQGPRREGHLPSRQHRRELKRIKDESLEGFAKDVARAPGAGRPGHPPAGDRCPARGPKPTGERLP